MDLSSFHIDRLIVHEVPRGSRETDETAVYLSDVESDLDDELRNLFRERMVKSLVGQRIEIIEEEDEESPVPDEVRGILDAEDQLVERSQSIARHLNASQNGSNPEGLLIVTVGSVDEGRCVGVMKLEREDAIRMQQTDNAGNRTFSIRHLRDLMMGKNTKVFKASLFSEPEDDNELLVGVLSDPQRGGTSNSDVSDFFLRRFLGCTLFAQPSVLTKEFYEETQNWINDQEDDARKAHYEIALISELNSPNSTIRVRDFAANNLHQEDRASYEQHMRDVEVTTSQIDKDLDLIAPKVKKMTKVLNESKIKVTGTPNAIEEFSEVVDEEEGVDPHLRIYDTFSEVRGGA